MAITVAGTVESLRTGTGDPMTWSHNVGTTGPKAVVVSIIHGTSSTDHVASVTYGTKSLRRIIRATDTAGEPGAAELWFGSGSIPTGTQTVTVDLTSGTTDDILGTSITLDAATNLVLVSTASTNENAANPSAVFTNDPGNSAMAFASFYSGLTALTNIAPGTDATEVSTNEISGNFTGSLYRQTNASTGSFTLSVTASSDDVAFAAASFGEGLVVASSGSYALTGVAATLTHGFIMAANGGTYTIVGANSINDHGVAAVSGSYALTGTDVDLVLEEVAAIDAEEGSYSITGTAATLVHGYQVGADAGEYAITGTAADLLSDYLLSAASGSYALSGTAASLIADFIFAAAAGSYELAGTGASLLHGTPGNYTIPVDAGSYALAGTAVDVLRDAQLSADAGSYELAGTDASLDHATGDVSDNHLMCFMGLGR